MLRTRFTELFGLDHPVMSAPMAMHSGGRLAAAVSAAGGLGSFGGIHRTGGPDWIQAQIDIVKGATDRPFAVGFITALLPFFEPLLDATLAAGPAAVALSFGDPGPWAGRVTDAGARLICQVQTLADADAAVDAGTDVLVVQGTEAGGHTGTMSLLPLLTAVAARHPDVPLLAAGGVADGASLAAVLTAGADGAWLGTAFLATPEAVEIDDKYKDLIVASDGTDTVWTRVYDIISGAPWPQGIGERVRRNRFTEEWDGREDEVLEQRQELAAQQTPLGSPPDPDRDAILYGQAAGMVDAIRPAGDVVRQVSEAAEAILRRRPASLLA
jgi:nitronate monooxygenase